MIEIQSPNAFRDKQGVKVFLGGSIEMGKAIDWQKSLVKDLDDEPIIILNPRRKDWDASWEQSIKNKNFRKQVEWELNALDAADIVVFYFDPNTMSPITLLELGIQAEQAQYQSDKSVIVCCPDGYWRKGNVEIVCKRYGIKLVKDYDALLKAIKKTIARY